MIQAMETYIKAVNKQTNAMKYRRIVISMIQSSVATCKNNKCKKYLYPFQR